MAKTTLMQGQYPANLHKVITKIAAVPQQTIVLFLSYICTYAICLFMFKCTERRKDAHAGLHNLGVPCYSTTIEENQCCGTVSQNWRFLSLASNRTGGATNVHKSIHKPTEACKAVNRILKVH